MIRNEDMNYKQQNKKLKLQKRIQQVNKQKNSEFLKSIKKILLIQQNSILFNEQEQQIINNRRKRLRRNLTAYTGLSLINTFILFTIAQKKLSTRSCQIFASVFLLSNFGLFTYGEIFKEQNQIEIQYNKLEKLVQRIELN